MRCERERRYGGGMCARKKNSESGTLQISCKGVMI